MLKKFTCEVQGEYLLRKLRRKLKVNIQIENREMECEDGI
jgi:hypothetical protein